MKSGLEILSNNEARVLKATEYLNKYKDLPLSAENDKILETIIVKTNTAIKEMNEARMPFTRKLNEVVAKFTAAENRMKLVSDEAQKKRNEYAKILVDKLKLEEKERLEKEKARLKLIEQREVIEKEVARNVDAILLRLMESLTNAFKTVNKENFDTKLLALNNMPTILDKLKYEKIFTGLVKAEYLSEIQPILDRNYQKYCDLYSRTVDNYKIMVAQWFTRLRENEFVHDGEQSELELAKVDKTTINIEVQQAKTELAFCTHDVEMPKIKSSYEIEILNKLGYQDFAIFWFEKIFKYTSEEDCAKIFDRVCKDVVKYVNKTDERLESKNISYSEKIVTKNDRKR